MASSICIVALPFAAFGWFETSTRRKPACRRSFSAAPAPGSSSMCSGVSGDSNAFVSGFQMLRFSVPSRSRKTARFTPAPLQIPIHLVRLQTRVRNQKVPDDRLQRFNKRRDGIIRNCGNNEAGIGDLRRITAVPTDDAKNACADTFCQLQTAYKVHADLALTVSSADRENKDRVLRIDSAATQPVCVAAFPSVVIDSGCKFGHVVAGRIAFHACDLAEVIDCMAGVARASANAEKEDAAAVLADIRQQRNHFFNFFRIQQLHGGQRFPEKALCVSHDQTAISMVLVSGERFSTGLAQKSRNSSICRKVASPRRKHSAKSSNITR